MQTVLYFIGWANIIFILAALVFLLFSLKHYSGVIGNALMYLSVGIILSALISVADLLQRVISVSSSEKFGSVNAQDIIHSVFATFAFIMITAGFYKLSRIYKRM